MLIYNRLKHFLQIGFLTFFPPLLMSVFIVFGGILMDVLIQRKKLSTTAGRKLSIAIGRCKIANSNQSISFHIIVILK